MPFDYAQESVRQGSPERSRRAHHERFNLPLVLSRVGFVVNEVC